MRKFPRSPIQTGISAALAGGEAGGISRRVWLGGAALLVGGGATCRTPSAGLRSANTRLERPHEPPVGFRRASAPIDHEPDCLSTALTIDARLNSTLSPF